MSEEIPRSEPVWDIGAKSEIGESTNVIIVDNKIGFFKMVWLLFKWLLALNIAIIPFALLYYIATA